MAMSCTVSLSVVSDTEMNHYRGRSSCGEGEGKVRDSAIGWGISWEGVVQQYCRKLEAKHANLQPASAQSRRKPQNLELSACHCRMFALTKQEVGSDIFSD